MDYRPLLKRQSCSAIDLCWNPPPSIHLTHHPGPTVRTYHREDYTLLPLPILNCLRSSSGQTLQPLSLTFPLSRHLAPSNPLLDLGAHAASIARVQDVSSIVLFAMLRNTTRTAAKDVGTAWIIPLVSNCPARIRPRMVGMSWISSLPARPSTGKWSWIQGRAQCPPLKASHARRRWRQMGASPKPTTVMVSVVTLPTCVNVGSLAVAAVMAAACHHDV